MAKYERNGFEKTVTIIKEDFMLREERIGFETHGIKSPYMDENLELKNSFLYF